MLPDKELDTLITTKARKIAYYYARIYRQQYRPDDLLAEALYGATVALKRYDAARGASLVGYIGACMVWQIKEWHQNQVTKSALEPSQLTDDEIATYPDPSDGYEAINARLDLAPALDLLPERQRRRVYAHYWQGESLRVIAEKEQVTESAIGRDIANSLTLIRTHLRTEDSKRNLYGQMGYSHTHRRPAQ